MHLAGDVVDGDQPPVGGSDAEAATDWGLGEMDPVGFLVGEAEESGSGLVVVVGDHEPRGLGFWPEFFGLDRRIP